MPHPHRAHGALRSRIILLAPVACARGQLLSPARHPAGGVQAGGRHEIAPDGREQLVELLGEQRVAKQPRRRAHLWGEEGAVVSTCMQPPRRPPPRRRAAARTPLCTAPRFSRGCAPRRPRIDLCADTPPVGRAGAVVSTCMQLRSVCWHATSKLAPLAQWRPFNQAQSSAIKRNQAQSREIAPRSSRRSPNGTRRP